VSEWYPGKFIEDLSKGKGILRKQETLGPTLKTLIKGYVEDYYEWVSVVVDRSYNIIDWWQARTEEEARGKLLDMLDRARRRGFGEPPFTGFVIKIIRTGL
jgi:hypothetical protein